MRAAYEEQTLSVVKCATGRPGYSARLEIVGTAKVLGHAAFSQSNFDIEIRWEEKAFTG